MTPAPPVVIFHPMQAAPADDKAVTLDQVRWSSVPVISARDDPILAAELQRRYGFVTGVVRYLTSVRWAARRVAEFVAYRSPTVAFELGEFINLVVTQENSCRYCWGAQRANMRMLGYKESLIARLEQNAHSFDYLGEGERAVLDLARQIARARPVPSWNDVQGLGRFGYSRSVLAELVFLAAIRTSFGSRIATPLALPPTILESMVNQWRVRVRVSRTLRSLRRRFRRGYEPAWDDVHLHAPFASFIQALRAVPSAAGSLQGALDDAWASPITSRRLKALAFAIIGFSLSARPVVEESIRLLGVEGVAASDAQHILEHLSSDRLDPLEIAVIQFARETVSYRTDYIQERCKALRAQVTEETLVEILMLCALANALSRMSMLLEPGA